MSCGDVVRSFWFPGVPSLTPSVARLHQNVGSEVSPPPVQSCSELRGTSGQDTEVPGKPSHSAKANGYNGSRLWQPWSHSESQQN